MNFPDYQSSVIVDVPAEATTEDALEAVYSLSPMQDGILFHSLLTPSADVYFRQALYSLEGRLEIEMFERAWHQLLHRHAILRTAFAWKGIERPLQVVFNEAGLRIDHQDWRGLDEPQQKEKLEQYLEADKNRGFDLSEAPLWRLALLRTSDQQYRFLLSFHHLLVDGWSIALLLKEVKAYYEAYSQGVDLQLPSPRPYGDYIEWLQEQDLGEAEAWWRGRLQGFSETTSLPFAGLMDTAAKLEHGMTEVRFSQSETRKLQAFAQQHQVTVNTLLQAAWGLLLGRHSGHQDVVFGATVSGRNPELAGIESMVGVFINTLPVRVQFHPQEPVLDWLKRVQREQAESYRYGYTPLVEIQRWSEIKQGSPLFETLLVFENYSTDAFEERYGEQLNGTENTLRSLNVRMIGSLDMVNYPLALLVAPGKELGLRLEYHVDRIAHDAAEKILQQLQTMLLSMAADPQQRVSTVAWMSQQERRQVVEDWNRTEAEIPALCVHQLFEQQAAKTPHVLAVECQGEQLTYAELNQRANQLAHFLRGCGVGTETRVALACERSLQLVIGILGILKAGGAYVPLDISYPAERLGWMLDDSQAPILLTQEKLIPGLPSHWCQVFSLDADWARIGSESTENPEPLITPENLAYLIYTSGSTGMPKGVAVEHQAISRLVLGRNAFDVFKEDVFLLFSPVTFDASTFELWASLVNGARLAIFPAFMPSLEELALYIEQAGVTVLWLTAGLFHQIVETQLEKLRSVRQLLTGGDVVSLQHVRTAAQALHGCTFINGYGPTENTTFTACHRSQADAATLESFPIGKPITNTTVFVLDGNLEPVPVGVPGELYTGGRGVSRGYFGRAELTAELFVPDPFSTRSGSRMYRTGDRVRWLPNGTLEFMGRLDQQVKIRGFRIEPGEVEAVLNQVSGVRQAVAIVREDTPGDKRLVAYVAADEHSSGTDKEFLRSYLDERLPAYMLPSAFVVLDKLPLTTNGKVDRKALPSPEYHSTDSSSAVAGNPIEEILAGIWAEVLGLSRVGRDENFFEVGGHSLLATQVVSRTRTAFGIDLPLRALFEASTISEFAKHVESRLGEIIEAPVIQPSRSEAPRQLSFAQQRLWFIDQLRPGSAAYNMPFAMLFRGKLHRPALEQSLAELVGRHEVLRTCFPVRDGQPVQQVNPFSGIEVAFVDLVEAEDRDAAAQALARKDALQPFDLVCGPLLRTTLVRLSAEHHLLLVTMHHIISDGWSLGIMVREFTALYKAFSTNLPSPLPELPIQYGDFAEWQRQWLTGERLNAQLDYWRNQLDGVSPLELPAAYSRKESQGEVGATLEWNLTEKTSQKLKELSRGEYATLFMTLLAGFQILLARYSGQKDVTVGTPIAGRRWTETESLVGFFVNTLVLRTVLRGDERFTELLARVRETTLESYAHQDLPFEKLVEELRPERETAHTPLFQAMLALQNMPGSQFELPGLTVSPVETSSQTANFDLLLTVVEGEGAIRGGLTYRTSLFTEARISRLLQHFQNLLAAIADDPQTFVRDLPLLNDAERKQIVQEWNGTEEEYPQRWMHELFEDQVKRTPGAVAVEYEDERLSYEELNGRSNQLAHYLKSLGVGPEVRVALCLERSLEMVVAIMAVLKAGGAYVPLDPTYPQERLSYMLESSAAPVLVAQARLQEKLLSYTGKTIHVDAEWERIGGCSDADLRHEVSGENLAYVIYTSGSTGKPKGAMNTHQGLSNRVQWMQRAYGLKAEDRVLQKTPFGFDVSVWEFMWPLMVGARLVMLRPGGHQDPACIAATIEDKQITTLHFVPAMLRVFLSSGGAERSGSVRRILCSGEALGLELARECREQIGAELHNLYGPTEASIDVTYWDCSELTEAVMIGKPIANTQIHVLDSEQQPVPVGVAGELYIGGVGVARGYLSQPGLTAERFVPNAFACSGGERLYRTGDLVKRHEDGNLEYLGRLDHQVKIRGNRIELGEIETVLEEQEGVAQAAVVVQEDESGDQRLVAYVVGESEKEGSGRVELEGSGLRRQLRARLPEYMVPSAYVQMEALPVNANGKLDRKRLPRPEAGEAVGQYRGPANVEEEILCGIWEQVLRVERVGVEENFFERGGHSLLATQVVSRIREAFGVEIPLRLMFERPTIARLAEAVKQARMEEGGRTVRPLVRVENRRELPMSYGQQRLWFLEQMEPGNAVYNVPFALRISGELDREALKRSMRKIVERHEVLRTVFEWNREQEAVQRVLSVEEAGVEVEVMELGGLGAEQREAEAQRLVGEEAGRGFNLSVGPLVRVKLLGMGGEEHVLLVTMHHIVSDGWSVGVVVREFMELYGAEREGRGAELEELEVQYGDYAAWQREWLVGGELQEQMGYWKEQLAGLETLELPTDHPRPGVMSHRGATVEMELGEELTKGIRELCRREGVTLFMALLGGVQVLLGRYAGQQDVAVGTPIANRTRREIEPLIGFFVNTLVLRGEVRKEWSFRELLKRMREVTLGAYGHQEVPFEQLVEELQPVRDLSRSPLFEVMLTVQNEPQERFSLPGVRLEAMRAEGGEAAKFDLTFSAAESAGNIRIGINYATELYEQGTIERMGRHLRAVLEEMSRNIDGRIGEIKILSDAERAQLVEEWNRTDKEYEEKTIGRFFEEQVQRTPKAIAVEYAGEQLEYQELNRRSNQLAHYLKSLGVGPEVRVALCLERSLEMVVAIMAVLKAGGAYVPLDPTYPQERLSYMLEESQAPVLLIQEKLRGQLSSNYVQVVSIDSEWDLIAAEKPENLEQHAEMESLAYVIYTSGSTGNPKGVGITHRGLTNYLRWAIDAYRIHDTGQPSVSPVHSPLGFDLTVTSIFPALLAGKCISLLAPGDEINTLAKGLQIENAYSVLKLTPSHLKLLSALLHGTETIAGVDALIIGGEDLNYQDLSAWSEHLSDIRVINEYGPTETVVGCCVYEVNHCDAMDGAVPIGKPIANTQLYVLDEDMQPVPIRVAGELYIGGAGVARGYLNRPDLTAARFVPNPFVSSRKVTKRIEGERLYRTGDQVRWRADGNLEFLGRVDQQVKLRGYRIELGEIEAALQDQPGVSQAAVVLREDVAGDKRLAAYVIGEAEREGQQAELKSSELHEGLRSRLPEYMLPGVYVQMEELPLTPNGKLDRKRLPTPGLKLRSLDREFQDARDSMEAGLKQIWSEVLGVEQIGIEDNFFSIGGHSLKTVLLAARISRVFKKDVPVSLIFDKPTIAEQSSFLRGEASLGSPGSLVPIQRSGARQPIFCVHPFFGLAHCYQELSSLLGPDQPFYGLQCYGLEADQKPFSTIPEMAKFYLKAIRTVQPDGPYQLAGWSMGALIAYESARQLAAEGEAVSFLGLFEGHVPQPAAQPPVLSLTEWEKLVNEREAENLSYMAKRVPATEEDASDPSRQMARYLAEFTDVPAGFSREQLTRLSRIIAINQLAVESYRPGKYSGSVSLFRVSGQADEERSYGWAELVRGELKIFEVPGTHDGFMSAPSVNIIASHLQCLLNAANSPSENNL